VDPPRADLDEEQHVERSQERRLHGEEVTGNDTLCLSPEELRPSRSVPSGSRSESMTAEQRADARGPDPDPERAELTLDPHASPPGVLPGQAKDQLTNLGGKRWASDALGPKGPLSPDQVPMPAKKRRGLDGERPPALTGSILAAAAEKILSVRRSLGRLAFLDRTFTWWRRTRISTSRSPPPPARGTSRTRPRRIRYRIENSTRASYGPDRYPRGRSF
jgi:hypothetical protein